MDVGRSIGGRNTDWPKSMIVTLGGETAESMITLSPCASAWKMPRAQRAANASLSWANSGTVRRRFSMMSPRCSPTTMSIIVTKSLVEASYHAA